jgi:hypothetical protein
MIADDVRQYAKENGHGVEEEDAIQAGMQEMTEKYKDG